LPGELNANITRAKGSVNTHSALWKGAAFIMMPIARYAENDDRSRTHSAHFVSDERIGAQDAAEHFVPPRAATPADPAQHALPGEPGLLQDLLLRDVAGIGSGLDPDQRFPRLVTLTA
jgi:hypothetical protein